MSLSTYSLYGQELTLDSILNTIKSNNPMLLQYDQRVNAMNAYTEGAKSWMAPMIGGGTFMTAYPYSTIMDERDKGAVMISAQQEIPNPAKLRAKKEFFSSKAGIEESNKEATFNELRAEAKQLYYQWLVLEKKKLVLKENQNIMEMMKKLAEIRYPYSQGSLNNVYKAEGRLYEVQNMLLMTDAEIEQKNIMLNTLMNLPKSNRFKIDTSKNIAGAIIQNLDTTNLAHSRSDVRALDRTIESMRLNTQLMRFDAKPDFNIRYDHMSPLGQGMPSQFTVMAMMTIPIAPWSSKMYKSQVKGMNYEIEAMKRERENILNEAEGMVKSMVVEIQRKQQQLDNYEKKIIPALQKNYSTVMLAYEENKGELPLVIDAWEAMNMAQMEYLNNLEQLYLMIVTYEKELEK